MKKTTWLLIIAVLFTAAFAIEAHHKKTTIFVYRPALPAAQIKTQNGSCFANAVGLNRQDAWRCQINNTIIDPCFKIKKTNKVICPKEYTGAETVLLKLTKPLPKPKTMPPAIAEAKRLDLPDGTVCMLYTGALPIVQNKNKKIGIQYGCTKQETINHQKKDSAAVSITRAFKQYVAHFFIKAHSQKSEEKIGILAESVKTGNVWIAKKVYYSQDKKGQWQADFIKTATIRKVWR